MTLLSANDAFTNPNSPWYYVVGSLFLLLIVAALVIYNVAAKKKREKSEHDSLSDTITDTVPPETDDKAAQNSETTAAEPEKTDETTVITAQAEEKQAQDSVVEEKKVEETKAEEAEAEDSVVEETKAEETKAEEAKTEEKQAAAEEQAAPTVAENTEKAGSAAKPAKKPAAKKTQKPFIDRLIANKAVHGVYNELKNTVLSYPGIKAKLGKDGETFVFGTDSKAEISLDGNTIVLKLAVDFDAVPEQFGAEKAEGTMPTKLAVPETSIDAAQRLITFAMNISMLTRNDRHRRVDYVQNAINAKNRAKSKQTTSAKAKK